ncbi:MAG: CopG family transcriptional regulator [Acidobacteria bacterium]|nr:CopG family transcriptional regulator [Acidobacteriota bacterium]
MEVPVTPEQETQLLQLAARTGRDAGQLLQEALKRYLEHEAWFAQEVEKGLGSLDRGEFIEHDDIVARMREMFQP